MGRRRGYHMHRSDNDHTRARGSGWLLAGAIVLALVCLAGVLSEGPRPTAPPPPMAVSAPIAATSAAPRAPQAHPQAAHHRHAHSADAQVHHQPWQETPAYVGGGGGGGGGTVNVHGYYRRDGTYVHGYSRRR